MARSSRAAGAAATPPTTEIAKAIDPYTDGTPGWGAPTMAAGMAFRDYGSSGLRQYGGWIREEILRALQGREAQRVYREMADNSAVVGAVLFAITQSMRKIEWRVEPASDRPEAMEAAEFADSLRHDMSDPWEDHVTEALSMLTYGFAPCEIVYKRRRGRRGSAYTSNDSTSKYNDGKIGIRRLPLRGQETILKWFFDANGRVTGLTQQPWVGPMIDLPIEKLLLYRPTAHKNNPEGRSILRTGYRAWYFLKRAEELEAISLERLSGLPMIRVPNALLEAAKQGGDALVALEAYKKMAVNVRIDEQMGIVLPSDRYKDQNGSPIAGAPMYEFELVTPRSGALRVDTDKMIHRYNVDILKTVLADFIDLGHQARGTQNLAVSKVDMFFQAIAGWLAGMAAVLNRYLLPRVWALNAMDPDLLPMFVPDLAQRVDLDILGKFVLALAQSGMRLFPDRDLENYIRDAAGLPDLADEGEYDPSGSLSRDDEAAVRDAASINAAGLTADPANIEGALAEQAAAPALGGSADVAKYLLGAAAARYRSTRPGPRTSVITKRRVTTANDVDEAAYGAKPHTASPAQLQAGNYPKGHLRLRGLDLSIENPRGTIRRGTGANGKTWKTLMPAHYGYVRRTTGADGMQVDVYLGPNPNAPRAFVVDQVDPDTQSPDEHKVLIGFDTLADAINTYSRGFSDGRGTERIGAVHSVSFKGFKRWVRGDDTVAPLGALVGKRTGAAAAA